MQENIEAIHGIIECVVTSGLGYYDSPAVARSLQTSELYAEHWQRGQLLYRRINGRELSRPLRVDGYLGSYEARRLANELARAQNHLMVMEQRAQHMFPNARALLAFTEDYDYRTVVRISEVVHPDRINSLIIPITQKNNQILKG